jgi:hypothetical protein
MKINVGATLLVAVLLLVACAGSGGLLAPATLPEDVVKKQILSVYADPKYNRNLRVETTGTGKILPVEKARGVDLVVCYKFRRETLMSRDVWAPRVSSGIAWRTGNAWRAYDVMEFTWDEHSCPGTYESQN